VVRPECSARRKAVQRARSDEIARLQAELEEVRPFLDLARAIRSEVARIADDASGQVDTLAEVIEEFPRQERLRVTRAIFDRLPPGRQWEILERVYGDEEIKDLLEAERAARLDHARQTAEGRALAAKVRAQNRLDTCAVPPHGLLTLGLFRETDVRAAVARGHLSATCARQVALRATGEPGVFRVIEDLFNPRGGYFVTAEYDEETWRIYDRLRGHTVVRAGSISANQDGPSFEPVLYPGGRVDFQTDGRLLEGRLHLGYAMLGDQDLLVG
jgi:hypothetical protein